MRYLFLFFLYLVSLYGADYDCLFVGSSPLSLIEALYQHACGKSVLILDDASTCGGVWKSIDICGEKHVDVGCHEIGNHPDLKEFLEIYCGCKMILFEEPPSFYFSGGCYELLQNLKNRIANTSIQLFLNHRVERAIFDADQRAMAVESNGKTFTADKIYASSYSFFFIGDESNRIVNKSKYYHLYLLISDPTPPRFSYQSHSVSGTSRMMNLTHFNDLHLVGRQLIVFQTHHEDNLHSAEKYLAELKSRNLIDPRAYILCAEPYIYEQWPANNLQIPTNYSPYFEQLNTFDFRDMISHISRWKQALTPYSKVVCE